VRLCQAYALPVFAGAESVYEGASRLGGRSSGPRRRLPLLVACLLSALWTTACGEKKAPETTAPAGFRVIRDAGEGFAVAVPADWQRIPLPDDLDQFDREAIKLTARNDKLAPAIVQARQLLQFGGKFMVVRPDGASSINLTVDKTEEKTLAEVGRATSASLTESGATNLQQEMTTSGAGPALKLKFRYPIEGAGGTTVQADEIQYFVLHEGRSYVLTVINGGDELASTVASSLRLR
jgi:hypothetical protein